MSHFFFKKNFSFFKKSNSLLRGARTLNFYEILGLDAKCSSEEIRSAYLKLVKQYHPDVNKDPGTDEKFKMITTAYEGLSTSKSRELYDAFMKNDPHSQEWKYKEEMYREDTQDSAKNFYRERAKYDKYSENFYKHQNDSNFWQGGKEHFEGEFYKDYENIFKGGFGGYKKNENDQKAENILLEILISLEDCFKGCEKMIKFNRTEKCRTCHGYKSSPGHRPSKCFTCNGSGEIKTSMFNSKKCAQCKGVGVIIKHPCKECDAKGVKDYECEEIIPVPKGIRSGSNIILDKKNGDLLVKVVVENTTPNIRRVGDDLIYTVEISLLDAIFGIKKEIQTWESENSKEIVELSPGVQSTDKVVFKQKGFHTPDQRGDLIVDFKITIPSPDSFNAKEQEQLRTLLS